MKYTDNALNIMTVKSYKGIGNAWIVKNLGEILGKNLEENERVETIVSLLNHFLKNTTIQVEEFKRQKQLYAETLNAKFEDSCDGVVALGDCNFPRHRGEVKDSDRPVFLYYKGDIKLLDITNKNVSVIGLLNPTPEIVRREQKIVEELVKNGATIVSGLALGCDSVSHSQALYSNGKTIAILPSPLNKILPTSNVELASEIVKQGGLLITEYGNDFRTIMELSSRYKERDRLQALFCDTIVLAASYAKDSEIFWPRLKGRKLDSGARLAMEYAKKYGIPRAVMYEEKTDAEEPMFDLCRSIIKEEPSVIKITSETIPQATKLIVQKKPKTIEEQKMLQF